MVSADGLAQLVVVRYHAGKPLDVPPLVAAIQTFLHDSPVLHEVHQAGYTVGVMGRAFVTAEVVTGLDRDNLTVYVVCIPIALVILWYSIGSSRLLLITVLVMACTYSVSFAIMYGVARHMAIGGMTPALMLSLIHISEPTRPY